MSPIPAGITKKHILAALRRLKQGVPHRFGPSTKFDLMYQGRRYPPKAVIGLAAGVLTGRIYGPGDFQGGDESKCHRILRKLGFRIEAKDPNAAELLAGRTWRHKAARAALPVLARCAHLRERIYYSDLGPQIAVPNPRNVGTALDVIGSVLLKLSAEWKESIPPLQSLAVSRASRLPGSGFDHFFKDRSLALLPRSERGHFMRLVHLDVFAYPRWSEVLDALGVRSHDLPLCDFDVALDELPREVRSRCKAINVDARIRALAQRLAGRSDVYVRQLVATIVRRDAPLIRALKEKYNYRCQFEACDIRIPMRDGGYYCEVAHIEPVSRGGPADPINLVVLCPNHHKALDHGLVAAIKVQDHTVQLQLNGKRVTIER